MNETSWLSILQDLEDLLSDATIQEMYNKINDSFTQPLDYYQPTFMGMRAFSV